MDKLLEIIEKNPRLSNSEIAVMLGKSEEETEEQIRLYEKSGIIKGYRAMIDKNKANAQTVTALIEIRVQPKFGHGFDEIANRIAALEEVESIYLMSGGFVVWSAINHLRKLHFLLLTGFLRLTALCLRQLTLFLKNIRSRAYTLQNLLRMTGGFFLSDGLQ